MKTLLLVAALAATACVADDQQIPEPTKPTTTTGPEATTTTTTVEQTTTTEAPATTSTTIEPEPVAEPVPATTVPKRTTTSTAYVEPRSPQGQTTRGDVWSALADCESGGANVDTGNGYSGFFQFLDSTWRSVGYSGRAVEHSYETQLAAAQTLQARSGWSQWPACSRQLGLR